jgi:hypothetical protein
MARDPGTVKPPGKKQNRGRPAPSCELSNMQ